MPLILAIDPDKRQSTQLASLVKTQLQAELVQRATAGEALEALQGRVPDLVLTTSLISPREDAVLATYLRELGAAAAHVQTVTIPLLGTVAPQRARGMLAALRREKPQPAMTDGCAPDVFADQIRQYLSTADEQKAVAASAPVTHAPIDATETYEASPFETVATPEPEFAVEPVPAVAGGDDAFAEAAFVEPAVEPAFVEPSFVEPEVLEPLFVEPLVSVEASTAHVAHDDVEPAALVEPVLEFEPLLAAEAPVHAEAALGLDPVEDQPVAEPIVEPTGIESEFDAWAASAPEPPAAVEAIAVAEAVEAEVEADADALVADEPAGLPLSQLLQLVSDWTSPAVAAPAQPQAAFEEFEEAFVEEPVVEAPAVEDALVVKAATDDTEDALVEESLVEETVIAAMAEAIVEAAPDTTLDPADWAEEELAAVANELEAVPAQPNTFAEVSIDPVAAQALDELSHQAPVASAGDGIPLEPPVPVVEMRSFQSLDSIANELAAAPPPKYDNLNDIASLFAASPSPGRGANSGFESLFATPSAPASIAPIEVPGIDPSLFAAPVARRTAPEPSSSFESLFASPPQADRDVFAAPSALEPALTELEEAPAGEFFIEPVVEPLALEPAAAEPVLSEPVAAAPAFDEWAFDEPIAAAPVFATPVDELETVEETVDFEAELAALAAAAPAVEAIEPVAVIAAPAPVAQAAVAADPLDEEIALDIDTFEAPKVETRFSFTLVDGFGDAWSDFEVPSAETAAADFGLSAQPPMDPYAGATEPVSASAAVETEVPSSGVAAPILDDEALSIIGDAARKASLDALVIEEFERGSRRTARKPKVKKVHAGATHAAAAAPDRAARKKGPVQDEWGLFDPEQCGFAALEDEESSERRPARDGSTRVRVISY